MATVATALLGSGEGAYERKAHRDAAPQSQKKCFIYRIAIVFGLSGMAGAAQAASLVVASGAGTRK
jgi:hypothetical protein